MPVAPAASIPQTGRSDFAGLTRIAREVYGPRAALSDAPRAGTPGVLDEKDRLTYERGGRIVSPRIGAARLEDLVFRKRVVEAAHALARSGASFAGTSAEDRVNEKLWTAAYGGRIGVRKWLADSKIGKPSAAIQDIFDHGDKYAFECSTAMMVIYYKAMLDHMGAAAFDREMTEPRMLAIFRWDIEDQDFTDSKVMVRGPSALRPGSHYYYENPGAPRGTAWQGENVIYLGDGKFYAHGIVGASGSYVVTEREILDTLRSLRSPGSTEEPRRAPFEMRLDGQAVRAQAEQPDDDR